MWTKTAASRDCSKRYFVKGGGIAVKENEFRAAFLKETLAGAVLADPTPFYEAFEESEEAMNAYWTALWEMRCRESGEKLSAHPCFPETIAYVLEDTEDGFTALVTVTLPATAAASLMKATVVFGSAMDPRVFAALPTPLKNGEALEVLECRAGESRAVALLHQGCDNGLQLFDPPTPQKRDMDTPLDPARVEHAFVDAVVCWCMEND